jgi:CRP/FNR family transcriptional regulator, cyclic AMP receptor protein
MSRVERERLPSLPIFEGLPEAELDAVAEAIWTVELEQGQPVATEGDFGHTLFFVEQGSADVVRDGTVLATVGPGDLVGEIAVLASGRRTASVVATSPMRLLAVFKRDVWGLERRAPEAARRLQAVLDARR